MPCRAWTIGSPGLRSLSSVKKASSGLSAGALPFILSPKTSVSEIITNRSSGSLKPLVSAPVAIRKPGESRAIAEEPSMMEGKRS